MSKKIETKIPKDLADMLGIILKINTHKPEFSPRIDARNEELKNGILTLTYNGDPMGWINDIKGQTHDGTRFRAVSVHGEVKHCVTIIGAREFICEKYQ